LAREEALRLVAILDHAPGRADDVFALGLVRLLDAHVAHEVRRARGRRLHVDAGVLQALDARLHQVAVVIEQRGLVEWARLVGRRRHPIVPSSAKSSIHSRKRRSSSSRASWIRNSSNGARSMPATACGAGPRVGASVMPPRAYSRAKPCIGPAPPSRGWRARAWR